MGTVDGKPNTPQNDILHDRYVRWQQVTITQLGYTINLILAFAGATIGFEITIVSSNRQALAAWSAPHILPSLLALGASLIFGVVAILSRLHDFRYTARIARLRQNGAPPEKIACLEHLTFVLGKATWIIFYGQIGSFALGELLGAIVLFPMVAYSSVS